MPREVAKDSAGETLQEMYSENQTMSLVFSLPRVVPSKWSEKRVKVAVGGTYVFVPSKVLECNRVCQRSRVEVCRN